MKLLCGIILLVCFMFGCMYTQFSPPFTPTANMDNSYVQGRLDGERAYQSNPAWILAGVGCGFFGVGAAWLHSPEPPTIDILDQPAEYVLGFREGYAAKGRSENTKYAALGWATWLLILVAATAE